LLIAIIYGILLIYFYLKYVPIIKPFQLILIPILFVVFLLTSVKIQWGILFFIFSFPLINNLPYFFGIFGHIPHAPTALVLFLFLFLGWLVHNILYESEDSPKHPIFKPMILFSIIIFISGIITFFRYTNFYPFLTDYVYELVTNTNGVTAGGAIMSTIFFSLNYLTGFAFFFILLNTLKSKKFIKEMLFVLCVSTFLSLSFGLFQHIKNPKLGNNFISINQAYINATFKDARSFGAYIAIAVPMILGLFFALKGIKRFFLFLVLVLSLLMIFFTGSKSGLFCLGFSLLIFISLIPKLVFDLIKAKSISLKKIILTSVLSIFLIVIIVFGFVIFEEDITQSITISRSKFMFSQGIKHFWKSPRARLWNMAIFMIKDYPLTGIGIGSYIIEVSNYAKMHQIQINPDSAENYILQIGSEFGLIGVFLVLWIFWEIIKQMIRSYKKFPTSESHKFILIGAIAGIVSFFVNIQSHTYIGSYEIKYTFWLLVALVFCLIKSEKRPDDKFHFNKNLKILSIILIVLFSGVHLWNSTHSLSLKGRTEQLDLKQNFGLYQKEKTNDGKEFNWTRSYGGLTIKIEKPVIEIPLLASHPDVRKNPVKVKIYLIKDFFKKKKLLAEIIVPESIWKTYEYEVPEEVNQEVILLIKVSRTWNPQKVLGVPDPRNLGVAVGKIRFKDKRKGQDDL